jgi:hypothetical protein
MERLMFELGEIIVIIFMWLVLGFFICIKKDWYHHLRNKVGEDQTGSIILTIIGMPLVLLYHFIMRFIIRDWD